MRWSGISPIKHNGLFLTLVSNRTRSINILGIWFRVVLRRECANGGGWSCEKDRGGLWFGAKLISETRLSRSTPRISIATEELFRQSVTSSTPSVPDVPQFPPTFLLPESSQTEHLVNRELANSSGMGETDDRRAWGGFRALSGAEELFRQSVTSSTSSVPDVPQFPPTFLLPESSQPHPQLEGTARLDATEHLVNRELANSSGMGETDDRRGSDNL
jgi:hypothetical protein